jgi:hypothetical protein
MMHYSDKQHGDILSPTEQPLTTIDNIMALADAYANARAWCHLDVTEERRQALRAAIEAALTPMVKPWSPEDGYESELNNLRRAVSGFHELMQKHGLHPGRTDDNLLAILDRELEASKAGLHHIRENNLKLRAENEALRAAAPQPQPCSPAEDGVCEALECCKDTVVKLRITANELIERDTALLRQALEALENSRSLEPVDIDWVKGKREATIAALRERLA